MNKQNLGSKFDEQLLMQLKGIVADRGAALDSETSTARSSALSWRCGRRALVGGAAAMAAVLAALVVGVGGEGTSTAFAVEPQTNGEVSVQISELSDAGGLQAALEQAGIPAKVTYLPAGMSCSRTGLESFAGSSILIGHANAKGVSDGPLTFRVDGSQLGPDQTLVVTAAAASEETSIDGANLQPLQVATGEVAPCDPVPAG